MTCSILLVRNLESIHRSFNSYTVSYAELLVHLSPQCLSFGGFYSISTLIQFKIWTKLTQNLIEIIGFTIVLRTVCEHTKLSTVAMQINNKVIGSEI